jgi:molybdate transport system substrate-binding protein
MDESRKRDMPAAVTTPSPREERLLAQPGSRPQSDSRSGSGTAMGDSALYVLSAGAAQGVLTSVQPAFVAAHKLDLRTSFGAVGTIKAKLLAGEPCDVVILTAALIEELVYSGYVRSDSARVLGHVRTAVAVRAGDASPDVASAIALRSALLASSGLYVPDIQQSTAGAHVVKVLRGLGIYDGLAGRLRVYPNGAAAMHALAESGDDRALGITQVTEINATPGVALAGGLPTGFELSTVYSAALSNHARQSAQARQLINMLVSPQARESRHEAGFED